uniref:Uncharacterized protein n=1 Tax=Molossus molossus TaxID=27622 RepID=A0A7J8EF05_MOLMO|nr:hypothetical protein HJG59_008951 [Molossus molossus]
MSVNFHLAVLRMRPCLHTDEVAATASELQAGAEAARRAEPARSEEPSWSPCLITSLRAVWPQWPPGHRGVWGAGHTAMPGKVRILSGSVKGRGFWGGHERAVPRQQEWEPGEGVGGCAEVRLGGERQEMPGRT